MNITPTSQRAVTAFGALVLLVGLSACSSAAPTAVPPAATKGAAASATAPPSSATTAPTSAPAATKAPPVATSAPATGVPTSSAVSGARQVDLATDDDVFVPTTLVVRHGESIQFVINNRGMDDHTIGQQGLAEATTIPAGRITTWAWTAPNAPGTYKLICAIHPDMIMTVTNQ